MSALFRRKSKAKLNGKSSPAVPPKLSSPSKAKGTFRSKSDTYPTPSQSENGHNGYVGIDDFGRPISPQPAFMGGPGGVDAYAPFSPGFGLGEEYGEAVELQLLYGYTPIGTTTEFRISEVDEIVEQCAAEIRERGLGTPLVLSSMALDLTSEGVCSLIRACLGDRKQWLRDLRLASPLSVGAFMKWALARLVNEKGTRGFVSWDAYESFKRMEREGSYSAKACPAQLISKLPTYNANLLTKILNLFSTLCAHSTANGLPPRKLASLFSPYVFGLSDDRPFDETYAEWMRGTDAFEHILLSFIRYQESAESLPTHLQKFVVGYPASLNISYSLQGGLPKIATGTRVEDVMRIRRLTRFHSRNIIRDAKVWEVPKSEEWSLFFPRPGSSSAIAHQGPVYTSSYRHLLNIRSNSLNDDDEDEGDMQRHRTIVQKEWSKFGDFGFKDVDATKLEFDLTESERNRPRIKRDTVNWDTFETAGFSGKEPFQPSDLIFNQNFSQRVQTWPAVQKAVNQRLRETEKQLPNFPYDTTPGEEPHLLIDANFFEAWADVLVCGGWSRDEMKESSFALIQWKSRCRDGELPKSPIKVDDDRSEDRWILVEEYVPKEYRDELRDGKLRKKNNRISFMRVVRGKDQPPKRLLSNLGGGGLLSPSKAYLPDNQLNPSNGVDQSVFAVGSGDTRKLSLSPQRTKVSYKAPSTISTTNARHGHPQMAVEEEGLQHEQIPQMEPQESAQKPPPPQMAYAPENYFPPPPNEIDSVHARGAYTNGGGGIGFQKPSRQKSFLARLGNRKQRKDKTVAPITVGMMNTMISNSASPPTPQKDDKSGNISPDFVPVSPTAYLNAVPGVPALHPDSSRGNEVSDMDSPSGYASPIAMGDGSTVLLATEEAPRLPPKNRPETDYASASEDPNKSDPYGGIEEDDATTNVDDAVEEGTIVYRGDGQVPLNSLQRPDPLLEPPRLVPVPVRSSSRPERQDSLPDSPKPDAEVPIDEEFRERDRFMSGASAYSNRVSAIVNRIEGRDGSSAKDVRLTQYGFGGESPNLGGVEAEVPPVPPLHR